MDPVTLTIAIKGAGMLGLIFGGILAMRYGFQLYRDGTGTKKDSYAFEGAGVKLKANSVGSVLMATAFFWGWAAVVMSPSLDKSGDTVHVYSFDTPAGELTSRTVAARVLTSSTTTDPEKLKRLFRRAVRASEKRQAGSVVSLAGVPATIDFASLHTSAGLGEAQLSANVHAGEKTASMMFTPQVSHGKITFVPAKASDGQ